MMTYNLRKYGTFLIFVLLAFTLWFVYRYQENFSQSITVYVDFINKPDHIVFDNEDFVAIDLVLSSSGFNLLKASYFPPRIQLDYADATVTDNGVIFLDLKRNLGAIKASLSSSYAIASLNEDYAELPVSVLDRKRINLLYAPEIVFKNNLVLMKQSFINGDSITISGDAGLINSIESLSLEAASQKIVITDSLQQLEVNIKNMLPQGVNSDEPVKIYEIRSTQMTEGTTELKVTITGVPDNVAVKAIPSTVKVTYTVPLKYYNSVRTTDFFFEVPYDQLTTSENIIPVIVDNTNDFIYGIRTVPSQIKILVIR